MNVSVVCSQTFTYTYFAITTLDDITNCYIFGGVCVQIIIMTGTVHVTRAEMINQYGGWSVTEMVLLLGKMAMI